MKSDTQYHYSTKNSCDSAMARRELASKIPGSGASREYVPKPELGNEWTNGNGHREVSKLNELQKVKILDTVPGANAVPRFSIEQAWMVLGLKIFFVLCMLTTASAQFNDPNTDHEALPTAPGAIHMFAVEERPDRLNITHSGKPIAEFVFRDAKILRPYFANVHAPNGLQVTRSHPPIPGVDAVDHDTMHPGIWLAFGELSGHDFWRNKGRIEHLQFVDRPKMEDGRLKFSTESKLVTSEEKIVCMLNNRLSLIQRPGGWLMSWEATFHSDQGDFSFGDQDEMGFGARMATPLCEKQGGVIVSSTARTKARQVKSE